ncbi:MAG: DUF5723 family protein [Bacteroidota bacterium]
MISKKIFFIFSLFTFHFSFFNASAQTTSVTVERNHPRLESSYDGLSWMGPVNHFSFIADSVNTEIFTSGKAYLNGNSLPFSFSKKLLQGGFLDNEIKSNAADHSKEFNTAELGFKYGAGFCTRLKKHKVGFELGDESISVLYYRRDLFNLVFFGNAQYENDTAFLKGSGLINQDFHRVRFIFSTVSGTADSSWQINASFSLLQGYHVNSLTVGKTNLFTAPMGEYLFLQSKFIYQTNDTSANNNFAFNGTGVSADICIAFPAGKSQLLFAINDAGYIHWNKKSLFYGMDTSVQFDGIELANILTGASSSLGNYNSDSILNYLGVTQSNVAFNSNLPLRFSFSWNRMIHENKIALNAGFSFLPQYENYPVFYASTTFNLKNFSPAVSVSYGGMQAFNMGLFLEGKICKHFNWMIGSGQLLSWLIPDSLNGIDAYSQLSYSF